MKIKILSLTQENSVDLHNVDGELLVKTREGRLSPAQITVKVNCKLRSQQQYHGPLKCRQVHISPHGVTTQRIWIFGSKALKPSNLESGQQWARTYVHSWYLAEFFSVWKTFQMKIVQKIKTQILWSLISPPPENRAVYELTGKKYIKPDRPQITGLMLRRQSLLAYRLATTKIEAHTQN
jgi:hypothetical protein